MESLNDINFLEHANQQRAMSTHIHMHYCQLWRPNKLNGASMHVKKCKCNKKVTRKSYHFFLLLRSLEPWDLRLPFSIQHARGARVQ